VTSDAAVWSVLRQNKGGIEVVAEERLDLSSFSDEREESAEVSALSKIKTPVILALPSTELLLRVMEFPVVDDDELEGMIELQVDKFSPFPIDQMVVSHEILARDENGLRVLVAAAREKAVDDAAAELLKQGVKIQRVDAALLGCWKNIVDAGELAESGRETLVFISGGSVEVLTHENGIPKALSCLGKVPDLNDAEEAEDIAQEVAHLLLGMEVEHGRSSQQRITLWSDGGQHVFAGALANACKVEIEEKSLGILPSVITGVVLRNLQGSGLLDLTPSSWTSAAAAKQVKRRLIASALGLFALWVLLVGGGFGWFYFEKIRLGNLEEVDAKWSAPANEVRQLRLQVSMIEKYTDHTYSALECLREISGMLPDGVDLMSFNYRKGVSMDIDGEADSPQLVNRFNEALNGSKLFSEVKPGPRTLTKKSRQRFSFDIKFPEEQL